MAIKDQIKRFEEEIISPIIEHLMDTEYAVAPPDSLVPEKVWKERIRSELTAELSGKEVLQRVDSAVEALVHALKATLSPLEIQEISQEWDQGVEKMSEIPEQSAENPELIPAVPLRKMMSVSEKTLGFLYGAGVHLYEKQDYVKAADVFFLLTLIDFQKFNIWLSLGLSELKSTHFEPALNAFAMASIINSNTPLPYMYSSECCIALGRPQESTDYLALAKEVLSSLPENEREVYLSQITDLQQKSKY